jgi:protein-L-isoaspartate(D-aspartate) O-methyltransferase
MASGPDFASLRAEMVERQLRRRGISDEGVLTAMGSVPRELFVPERLRRRAYADSALPIGEGQTISQPWIVAAICQALRLGGGERVLEVGTGSGYSAAVLSLLAREVFGVELQPELAAGAKRALAEAGAGNVTVVVGDGGRGLPEQAPFEAIAVHAAAPAPPRALLEQLVEGGRLVAPVAIGEADMLTVFSREGDGFTREEIGPCRFVPLLGEEGFGGA